jgi:hypothetical protein
MHTGAGSREHVTFRPGNRAKLWLSAQSLTKKHVVQKKVGKNGPETRQETR